MRARVIVLAWLALAGAVCGQTLEGRVKTHVLKNGMTFLLMERHTSPTVAFYMRFHVGSVDEYNGINGTAHLLEHMLFKGTRTLGTKDYAKEKPLLDTIEQVGEELDDARLRAGDKAATDTKVKDLAAKLKATQDEAHKVVLKDEIDEVYTKAGGVGFNASTNQDLTTYIISLPSNRLEMWARIESDRMLNPVLREYYSERDVIMEERRMRTDASPTGTLFEQFGCAAYTTHHYGVPVIGPMSEIKFLSKGKTEEFRKIYYAPNNTVAALVGDFDTEKLIPLLEKYFERIPPQTLPRPPSAVEPEQIGERRLVVEQDANPTLIAGWHKPNLPHRDDYVFDVISNLLTDGRSSRMYRRLVKDLQIAVSVDSFGSYPGSRFPNLFLVMATPRAPHTAEEVEKVIYEEIERLKNEPIDAKELEKCRNQMEASFVRALDSNEGLSSQLSSYQALIGDWRYIEQHPKVIRTIDAAEIQKVARKYLVASNRTVGILVKKKAEDAVEAIPSPSPGPGPIGGPASPAPGKTPPPSPAGPVTPDKPASPMPGGVK